MAVSPLMSLGTRAMSAAYAQLQTTSHNISNASVPGYSRQEAQLATADGRFTGSGFFGRGVDVTTIARAHDALLTREAVATKSQAAADSTRLSHLNRLEDVFPTGAAGIGYAAGQLTNAFVDVANSPSDTSARQVVLSNAQTLAARFRDAGNQLDTIQSDVTSELKASITSVNAITANLAKINQQIVATNGLGQPPNDLLDQRDKLISDLSGYVQLSTVAADDGSISVFTGSGQPLVLGASSNKLVAVQDPYDGRQFHLGINEAGTTRTLPDDLLASGSIAGLLKFQSEDLKDARNQLGRLATAIATSVNQQQALGINQQQPASAGTDIFSIGAPQALASSKNTTAATVDLRIDDPAALQASDYELRADPSTPGSYLVTRLSDGQQTTFAGNTATIDGVEITIGATPPAAGDRFLLQPVGSAAGNMTRVLSDPRGVAAASPVTGTLGSANTGTARIASLTATDPAIDPSISVDITFGAGGSYNWAGSDGSSGSGTWQAGTAISPDGTWALQLDGVPGDGDTIRVAQTPDTKANNGNALAFVALGDQALVGNETFTVAYASVMSDVGVRVSSTKTAAALSTSAADAAETSRANHSGVNLDEEAARLIEFQQSYQAAAKMLQVAQSVFDTLLQTTRPS